MQEFFTAISNFGFPIVVAGYLLFRFEGKMEKLSESVRANTESNRRLEIAINDLTREVKDEFRGRK